MNRKASRRHEMVLCVICIGVAVVARMAMAEEIVAEDSCVVELQLPAGATVSADGKGYGSNRRLAYESLTPRRIYQVPLAIHYPSGKTSQHNLLIEGGRRVRLARLDPGNVKLELVEMAGLPSIMNYVTTREMKYLAAGHENGTVSIWDMQQRRLLRYFAGELALRGVSVERVAMALNMQKNWLLAEADYLKKDRQSRSKVSILYDIQTGRKLRTFDGGTRAFSTDGRWLLTSVDGDWIAETQRNGPGSVVLWDAESGRKLRTFDVGTGYLLSIAISPDGRFLLSATASEWNKDTNRWGPWSAVLWDVERGQKLRTYDIGFGNATTAALSPDNRFLLTAVSGGWIAGTERGNPGSVMLWDVESGQKLRTFDTGSGQDTAAAFSPDGRQILTAAGGRDKGSLILWDTKSGQKLRIIEVGASFDWRPAMSAVFSLDGLRAMVGSTIWDTATGAKTWAFTSPANRISGAHFSANGTRLVTFHKANDEAHSIVLWDAESGQKLRTVDLGGRHPFSVDLSPDGRKMVAVVDHWNERTKCSEYSVAISYAESDQKLRTFDMGSGYLASAGLSPDHRRLLTLIRFTNENGEPINAIVWDVEKGQKERTFEIGTWYLSSAQFSPDGRKVLIRDDKSVLLWDIESGQKARTFDLGSGTYPGSAVFSPDGRQLVVPGNESLSLWDIESGQKVRTFDLGSGYLEAVNFSPDGRRIVTRSSKPTDQKKFLIFWDVESGQKLRTIDTGSWYLKSVEFSPDGRKLLTLNGDGEIAVWDIENGTKLRTTDLGEQDVIWSASFDPAGRHIRAFGAWRFLYIIDWATGDCVLHGDAAGDEILYTTADGYFEGPAEARQEVCYRVGGGLDVVPVDRFFGDFYRPGLLAEILQGQRPTPDVQLGHSLPPIVRIVSPKAGEVETAEVTLDVQASDQGGGVANLSLFQNGARVLAPGEAHQEGKVRHQSFRIGLVEGENKLRITASSDDGSWESEPAELVLRYEKPLAKSRLYVLAVGVNKYADANYNLSFAATDAQAMADVFRRRAKRLYEQVSVTTLTDQKATRTGIKSALEQVAAETRPQDTLVLFLAGHGMMVGQRYYFLPYELHREAESLEADIRKQALPGDELGECLAAAPALKRVMILDTCASGGALALLVGRSRSGNALRGTIERLSRSQGVFAIAAAGASQQAEESKELGHGILTYSLLAGLKAIDAGPLADRHVQPSNPERVVNVLEWFTFADGQVRELTAKLYGAAQDAQFSKKDQSQSFPLLPLDDE
jgi:WD40 repeat protein